MEKLESREQSAVSCDRVSRAGDGSGLERRGLEGVRGAALRTLSCADAEDQRVRGQCFSYGRYHSILGSVWICKSVLPSVCCAEYLSIPICGL